MKTLRIAKLVYFGQEKEGNNFSLFCFTEDDQEYQDCLKVMLPVIQEVGKDRCWVSYSDEKEVIILGFHSDMSMEEAFTYFDEPSTHDASEWKKNLLANTPEEEQISTHPNDKTYSLETLEEIPNQ